jgi:hypothetical protein
MLLLKYFSNFLLWVITSTKLECFSDDDKLSLCTPRFIEFEFGRNIVSSFLFLYLFLIESMAALMAVG